MMMLMLMNGRKEQRLHRQRDNRIGRGGRQIERAHARYLGERYVALRARPYLKFTHTSTL